ncbi:NADH:flavin oxidoreductase/NADH oxidase family protein [Henriciella litoralis]|uniref:NADH:flavin oxidoreductase/NADH oxidase family protein n=1 Tax=Henriciella litoralis TaxID=568102 RepID=UPI0009FD73BB|nr:NADH:flavin oxidoreductase/NADH oxidase family protein [Henriciella litoralis]
MTSPLEQTLKLPCGAELPNRLCKAAMTEQIAKPGEHLPHAGHQRLYKAWGKSGCGVLLTGNVIIDRQHLESPGNVVIDAEPDEHQLAALKAWAEAGQSDGAKMWMQISHAGRQTPKNVNAEPLAPSAVPLGLPGDNFGKPRAMTETDIRKVIEGFARCARVAKAAGFDGVQVHAAHGYLLSQFLNPRANIREDEWGGPLENRARLLLAVVFAVRAAVGDDFPVSVKLNSADFQKGGFSFEECRQVVKWLSELKVDLLEISGGNYEQPKLLGIDGLERAEKEPVRESTKAREAYFVDYAGEVRGVANMPVMATGGFRSKVAMEEALEAGLADMIGIGAPLCTDPQGPAKMLAGETDGVESYAKTLRLGPGFMGPQSKVGMIKMINALGQMAWNYMAILAISEGRKPARSRGLLSLYMAHQKRLKEQAAALNKG